MFGQTQQQWGPTKRQQSRPSPVMTINDEVQDAEVAHDLVCIIAAELVEVSSAQSGKGWTSRSASPRKTTAQVTIHLKCIIVSDLNRLFACMTDSLTHNTAQQEDKKEGREASCPSSMLKPSPFGSAVDHQTAVRLKVLCGLFTDSRTTSKAAVEVCSQRSHEEALKTARVPAVAHWPHVQRMEGKKYRKRGSSCMRNRTFDR